MGLAVAVIVAMLVAGCGSEDGTMGFGSFAGYVWHGRVRQISANVVVPHVRGDSSNGWAATWIGAEGRPNRRTLFAPFFQVGVAEGQSLAGVPASPHDFYNVWWSSTALGFHPHVLFDVSPGEVISLSMTLAHDRWVISAIDKSTDSRSTFRTRVVGNATFKEALWTQEDPVSMESSSPLPYPDVSPAVFSVLRVNHADPTGRSVFQTWMSSGAGTLGPTDIRGNSFVVKAINPPARDFTYQRIVDSLDLAQALFSSQLAGWGSRTHRETIRKASLTFVKAAGQSIHRLRAYPAPRSARLAIRRLVQALAAANEVVRRLAVHPTKDLRTAQSAYERLGKQETSLGLEVKRRLDMPETGLGGVIVRNYVKAHEG